MQSRPSICCAALGSHSSFDDAARQPILTRVWSALLSTFLRCRLRPYSWMSCMDMLKEDPSNTRGLRGRDRRFQLRRRVPVRSSAWSSLRIRHPGFGSQDGRIG